MISAAAWMIGTLISFCLMAVGARELSAEVPIMQTLTLRSAIGLVVLFVIVKVMGQTVSLNLARFKLHCFRNIFHFSGQYFWFLGVALLPLAEVFALEFTVPLWVACIAAIFLRERLTALKGFAIILGLIGVFVVVRPGFKQLDLGVAVVLFSACCYAIAHTSTKALSSSESPLSILLYMCLIQLPFGLFFSLPGWVWPHRVEWGWIILVGLAALSAHFCMVKAMQKTDVTIVMTMDFLRLPLIALVGVVLYREPFSYYILIGSCVMLLANVLIMGESRRISFLLGSRSSAS